MLTVEPISAFSDNYIWLLHLGQQAWVVDPGEAAPVLAALNDRDLTLQGVLLTHHHFDHTGGMGELLANYPDLQVIGPDSAQIDLPMQKVGQGDEVTVLDVRFSVFEVPGHTLDHIAFYATEGVKHPLLFCGDTLFAGGCGRIFEGTPAMMLASLQKLAGLAADARVYCAHEYTLANLDFALVVEPGNSALLERYQRDQQTRRSDQPTVPSTLALELATNPFLRSTQAEVISSAQRRDQHCDGSDLAVFAAVREWKNNF